MLVCPVDRLVESGSMPGETVSMYPVTILVSAAAYGPYEIGLPT